MQGDYQWGMTLGQKAGLTGSEVVSQDGRRTDGLLPSARRPADGPTTRRPTRRVGTAPACDMPGGLAGRPPYPSPPLRASRAARGGRVRDRGRDESGRPHDAADLLAFTREVGS